MKAPRRDFKKTCEQVPQELQRTHALLPRATAVPVFAGAGEVSAIGAHRLARDEVLLTTGHTGGRVLLLRMATARCGAQHRVRVCGRSLRARAQAGAPVMCLPPQHTMRCSSSGMRMTAQGLLTSRSRQLQRMHAAAHVACSACWAWRRSARSRLPGHAARARRQAGSSTGSALDRRCWVNCRILDRGCWFGCGNGGKHVCYAVQLARRMPPRLRPWPRQSHDGGPGAGRRTARARRTSRASRSWPSARRRRPATPRLWAQPARAPA
jgi:hypothetical protein